MSKYAPQVYQSYLVRCWLIPPAIVEEVPVWRFELQVVAAEPEKHIFGSYELLMAFVAARLAAMAGGGGS